MFKKTPRQSEATKLLSSKARNILLYGGSRSGKSAVLVYAIITRAIKSKSRHVILRQQFNHVKQSIVMDTFPKVFKLAYPDVYKKSVLSKSDWYYKLPNESEIWFGGLDDKERTEKILGNEYTTIMFNECSQMTETSVNMALTRLAEKNNLKKKAYFDENPPRKTHWSYKWFKEHITAEGQKLPSELYADMLMNPHDNIDNIDEDYIRLNLENLPPLLRKRFLEGEFCDAEDAIFKSHWFRPTEGEPDIAAKFIAVDPAISEKDEADDTVICCLGIDYDNIIHEVETVSGKWSFNKIVDNFFRKKCRHSSIKCISKVRKP